MRLVVRTQGPQSLKMMEPNTQVSKIGLPLRPTLLSEKPNRIGLILLTSPLCYINLMEFQWLHITPLSKSPEDLILKRKDINTFRRALGKPTSFGQSILQCQENGFRASTSSLSKASSIQQRRQAPQDETSQRSGSS